jgi:dipeptidyl aminopeptidase/acylaminoacyl peptidase
MPTPFVPSDLLRLAGASDPRLAPDGETVYFRRTWIDEEKDENCGAIWRVGPRSAAAPFTGGRNDRLARIAPDGAQVAFVADRDGAKARIFTIGTDGGEARARSSDYAKILSLEWSPDGTQLGFVATAPFDATTAPIYLDERSGARHIRMLPFKSDADGLLDGVRKHLFVLSVGDGSVRQLTAGAFDVGGWSWSPDGTRIAFSAKIGLPEDDTATADIHVVTVADGALRTLTDGRGPLMSPSYSHDGTTLAFIGHQHLDDAGGRFNAELLIMPANGGAIVSLSADIDRTIGDTIASDLRSGGAPPPPAWTADDREIVVQVSDEGSCEVRAFPRAGGTPRTLAAGARSIFAYALGADGALAIAYTSPAIPAEVALVRDGSETALTDLNPFLAERMLATVQRYRPAAADGTKLDGWYLEPPGATGTVPLVLEVHGGPHAAYGHAFFAEFQVLAGLGFAVAYGNPRGSQSYGRAYADAITGDWGGIDAADVLTILDGALACGDIDRARIGVAGGSYGGFMTTWLLGHSDRFAAGVSMRAVNDFVSEAGASDLGWFLEREVGAPERMADAGRKLFENSPLRAAHAIDAPLLVEHSERDFRCPIDQGEQLFTLLRRLGKKEVEFVRFTGDGHELSRSGKPRSRLLRLRAIGNWFVRHLGAGGSRDAGSLFAPVAGEAVA